MTSSLKAFLKGIMDYAGMFPPADLSLDTSIQKYSDYRKCDDAWMLSKFIIPASRLTELEPYRDTLFSEGEPFAFSVLGKGTDTVSEYRDHLKNLVKQIQDFHNQHGSRVTTEMLEIKLPREVVFACDEKMLLEIYQETAEMMDESELLPSRIFFEGFFEENWKKEIGLVLEVMGGCNETFNSDNVSEIGFKMRCGGIEAPMFPSVDEIVFTLNRSRECNLALKYTAGLHHPIRHYSDSVQTKMHGFFNVFGGALLGYEYDLSDEKLTHILNEEDPEHFKFTNEGFAWNDLMVPTKTISELRDVALISFGSCSFDEPREDLQQLGLL